LHTGDNYNQEKDNIHYINPVEDGGDVYKLDNLAVVGPETHRKYISKLMKKTRQGLQ